MGYEVDFNFADCSNLKVKMFVVGKVECTTHEIQLSQGFFL